MKSKIRKASVQRKTSETDISVTLAIGGNGKAAVDTGIPFLDHMLTLLAKHSLMNLAVKAKGDLGVDIHHTNEDVGITLGEALTKALGNKAGIRRYGFFSVPMDEAMARVTLDISGRPSLHVTHTKEVFAAVRSASGKYTFHDASEFLKALTQHAGINMHLEVLAGEDAHHILEAIFKALAKALDMATQIDPRMQGVPSTKGRL
ncbi:MAG: imidazoleglycerol-phosphate dehydratase HisB [Candidatus Omnitrophica bacterium]|nr:imidazoleglycerol-phosphate dehydratase HisB [Candidatus Omnitrophota bacterium]MDD5671816.1 imidazoleglycerol-phosphate dehydratase HisB [Candidatus Omnitrophota bacterium]